MTRGGWAALALLSASVVGVTSSFVVWAMVGWADALAAYVVTLALIGLLLLRLAGIRPRVAATDAVASRSSGEPSPGLVVQAGLSLAESLTEPDTGLHRLSS